MNITDHALEPLLEDGIPFPDGAGVLLACAIGARSTRYATCA